MSDTVYKVIELVGTSDKSWEDAAKNAVELAGKSLKDLRIAEVTKLDVKVENGRVVKGISFVELRESTAPRALPHFDRLRSATVTGSVREGYALASVLGQIGQQPRRGIEEGDGDVAAERDGDPIRQAEDQAQRLVVRAVPGDREHIEKADQREECGAKATP